MSSAVRFPKSPPEATFRATAITLITLTSIVFVARTGVQIWSRQPIRGEDGFLIFGFLCFLSLTILYLVVYPPVLRTEGAMTTGLYPGIMDDTKLIQRIYFTNIILLWFSLWAIKFAFLLLYRKLVQRFATYMRVWWAVLVTCILALIGCLITQMLLCKTPKAYFEPGQCNSERDNIASAVSLYFAYAVDVLTDLMIMILPLQLLYTKLARPLIQKIAIGALFSIGIVNIIVATIRVVQVTDVVNGNRPSPGWLALFSVIESGVTIIIGCCPGVYASAKDYKHSRKGTNNATAYGGYQHGSRGYARHTSGNDFASRTPSKGGDSILHKSGTELKSMALPPQDNRSSSDIISVRRDGSQERLTPIPVTSTAQFDFNQKEMGMNRA